LLPWTRCSIEDDSIIRGAMDCMLEEEETELRAEFGGGVIKYAFCCWDMEPYGDGDIEELKLSLVIGIGVDGSYASRKVWDGTTKLRGDGVYIP